MDSILVYQPAISTATHPDGPSLAQAVEQALAVLPAADTLTLLINDPERHTSSSQVLDVLGRHVDLPACRILVATGSHSFHAFQRAAFERQVGGGVRFAAVAWHDSHAKDLVAVGQAGSWRGHPWLTEPPPLLAIGSVEPHYFAGFTGAHKTATIGCASYANIEANHSLALDPACRPCALEGNPVADGVMGMLADLEAARPVACVNLVQAGTEVAACAGGTPGQTLRQLRPFVEQCFVHHVDQPADAVIAEVEGPLGVSFYQADKAIKNNASAVRDGGTMILKAMCRQGIGQDAFVRLLREAPTHRQAVERVRREGYRLGDHKAVRLRYLTDPDCRNVRVFLVSPGLSVEQAALLGLAKVASEEEAMARAGLSPSRHRILRVLDAGNVCVLVRVSAP